MRLPATNFRPLSTAVALLAAAVAASAQACDLPSSYRWTSSGPLAEPNAGWEALRDFTVAPYRGQQLVYASTQTRFSTWGTMAFSPVPSLAQLGTATQTGMDSIAVAPTLFYFAPKSVWILAHQWGPTTFSYRTSSDPAKVDGWSAPQPLFTGSITESGTGPIDPAVIGDDENMYLFFCGDNGKVYRASMPIGNFPGSFGSLSTVVMSDRRDYLFEGVQVYTLKGQRKYLMMVDAFGSSQGRYLRSFTATSLDGPWTPNAATEANAFASKSNSNAPWTDDISHGELVRDSNDQTFTVDPCKPLQVLYQGRAGPGDVFSIYKYRPALLTQSNVGSPVDG